MKKLLSIIGASALAVVVINSQADTFEQGAYIKNVPISDQQLEQIKVIWRATGQTNVPLKQFSTNYVVLTLSDEAKTAITQLKFELSQKIQACTDDTTLVRIKNILDGTP